MNKLNLWNLSEGKTKTTINYIKNLRPKSDWSSAQVNLFDRERDIALSKITANNMLKYIGYKYKKLDGIFIKIMRVEE